MTSRTTAAALTINRRSRVPRTIIAIISGLSVLLSVFAPTPAGATQATNISGNALPSDCNNGRGDGSIELSGDLEGCLVFYVDSYTCTELEGFALYEEIGTEIFDGTIDGREGRFRTRYTLAGTYLAYSCAAIDAAYNTGGAFPWSRQLTGGCDHEILGDSGAFRHKTGLIVFHDIVPEAGVSGASNFFYSGYVA